jgi:putative PIN family toxin of toxin-antitoxin system
MRPVPRLILDTSTLVSAALRTGSVPDQALSKALRSCQLCASLETLDELARVLEHEKFERYRDKQSRRAFFELIRRHALLFEIRDEQRATVDPICRDPKDNPFLALALACEADIVVSSDQGLLVLHPWRGIPILTPGQFLG